MYERLKSNAFIRYGLLFCLGVVLAYFILPVRVVTKEVKVEVVKYVRVKSKEDIVIVKGKDGTVTTRIKRDTDVSEDIKSKSASYEKTEINPRHTRFMPGIGIGKNGLATVGGLVQRDMFGKLGIFVGGDYDIKNKDAIGKVGVSISL